MRNTIRKPNGTCCLVTYWTNIVIWIWIWTRRGYILKECISHHLSKINLGRARKVKLIGLKRQALSIDGFQVQEVNTQLSLSDYLYVRAWSWCQSHLKYVITKKWKIRLQCIMHIYKRILLMIETLYSLGLRF